MTCPICAKDTDKTYRPFCSKRCADLDLAKWLGGGYALPGATVDPEDLPDGVSDEAFDIGLEQNPPKPRIN